MNKAQQKLLETRALDLAEEVATLTARVAELEGARLIPANTARSS